MRKMITGCVGLAVLLVGSTAFAEFAEKKTLAISADRMFGIYMTQANADPDGPGDIDLDATEIGLLWQGDGLTPYTVPRLSVDFFVIDHLSIGGTVAYANVDGDDDLGYGVGDSNQFLFGPRIGGAWMLADWAGFWPRGGIHYYSRGNGDGDYTWQLALNAEATFVLKPWENFAFTVGPAFDIGITGKFVDDSDGPNDPDYEETVHLHSIGLLSVGIMGYFNL